ncbi:MAG: NAD-dependent epimerase/dehydratase family protein [Bacteroidota bacterium]
MPYLILGAGYTGRRVVRILLAQGHRVIATTRSPDKLADLAEAGAAVWALDLLDADSRAEVAARIPDGVRVLHSVPTLRLDSGAEDPTPRILDLLGDRPARVVYLSSTGVYGNQNHIDETTPAAPSNAPQRLRRAAEERVLAGPWSALVLRPAAIYGPDRGMHISMQRGRYKLVGDGNTRVGTVHADDLAALAAAALQSDLTGAFPVADADPALRKERVAYVVERFGLPWPPSMPISEAHHTQRHARLIDASFIWNALGVDLQYPSFRDAY